MADIIAQDCTFIGNICGGVFTVLKAMHAPTGIEIEFAKPQTKRQAIQSLQIALNAREATDAQPEARS